MRHVCRRRRQRRHQRPVAVEDEGRREEEQQEEHSAAVEAEQEREGGRGASFVPSFLRSFAISARGMHTRHLSISALNLDDFRGRRGRARASGESSRKVETEERQNERQTRNRINRNNLQFACLPNSDQPGSPGNPLGKASI